MVYKKESIWAREVNFKSEHLAGFQDIKYCFFFFFPSSGKHYLLLSWLQLHFPGIILINKLLTQIIETLNLGQLLLGWRLSRLWEKTQGLGPMALRWACWMLQALADLPTLCLSSCYTVRSPGKEPLSSKDTMVAGAQEGSFWWGRDCLEPLLPS